jgi:SAM-dependent methyltransferase
MIRAGASLELFAKLLREAVAGASSVLDIGTSQRFAKELRPHRELLLAHGYRAAGYKPEPMGEDTSDLDLDVQDIALPSDSEDCVICLEVLEHVADPFTAANELVRIIKPGGRLFLTVPFLTSYHGKGETPEHSAYPDYWRFTHQGLQLLFRELDDLRVYAVAGRIESRLRLMMLDRFIDAFPLRQILDRIDRPMLGKMTIRHIVVGRKPIPALTP